jgi:hypothetical protein
VGRKLHYKPGSFYRVDDRTGFPQRAEITRQEWNGLIVDQARWEIRQPQDLVKGVTDVQSVPQARPLAQNIFVGPISVQITANAVVGQKVIQVNTTFGLGIGAIVGVMLDLDMGSVFWAEITAISGLTITLSRGLPFTAASGNLVTQYKPGTAPVTPPETGFLHPPYRRAGVPGRSIRYDVRY